MGYESRDSLIKTVPVLDDPVEPAGSRARFQPLRETLFFHFISSRVSQTREHTEHTCVQQVETRVCVCVCLCASCSFPRSEKPPIRHNGQGRRFIFRPGNETHTHTHTHTHTRATTHTHTQRDTHTHTHTHATRHTHTQRDTHTHAHTHSETITNNHKQSHIENNKRTFL